MPNLCSSHPAVRESGAPAWNGWGNDLRNTRSQSAKAAGLTPGQVSRLQLKWAFGFPGATALYSQTVYDGRLYVTSNAGDRVFARRGHRLRPLEFPRAVGRPQRLLNRPDEPEHAPRGCLFR